MCVQTPAPSTTVVTTCNTVCLAGMNTAAVGTSASHTGTQKATIGLTKPTQSGLGEQISVLPSLPVAVKPPATINVLGTGFSSPITVSCIPQVQSGVTLSSIGSGSVASSKTVEPVCKTSKQVYIAPKPSTTSVTLTPSAPAGQVSISVLPTGTQKPTPKPVQIAPKPPVAAPSLHSNTQILASQTGHLMQTQVQTLAQPVHTVQAINPPVQTMQAIPQPIQAVQAVAGMPVQAVITQGVIDPTHLVNPSSPAKIITQPVFVTSSMQSAVTYSITPQPVTQGHLPGNMGAVHRMLTPTVVGKVATNPQTHLMAPKGPESLVTLAPATVGSTSSVRPIVPLPQPMQPPQQAQIVAVNVMPIGSAHMQTVTGQTGLVPKQQGPIPPPGPAPLHHPVMVTANTDLVSTQSLGSVPISQPLVYTNATSQIPVAAVMRVF